MQQGSVERRRGRRIDLQAPLLIRRIGTREPGLFKEQQTQNLGLAGVYFETDDGFEVNEVVMTSVSIPESQRRGFPFTRLAGQGRVVRVKELAKVSSDGQKKKYGIALEFGNDLTALTSIPSRG